MEVIVIVAGVSGSGKSTVGALLAGRLGWPFTDGDALHPASNIAKMTSGAPLTDADRIPWLHAIAAWIDGQLKAGQPGVLACSALKRKYRDLLLNQRTAVGMAFLQIDKQAAARRLAARHGHFFDPDLLDSQFADLEPPGPDEKSVAVVPVRDSPEETADEVMCSLGLGRPADQPDPATGGLGTMFEQAAGLALLAAFYPPAMVIAAVYLVSARPGRMVVVYLAGGILMVTIVGTAVLLAIRAGGLSHVGQHPTRYGLRLGLGVLAIIAAVVIARRRPKPPDPAKPRKPSLVERLSAEPKALKAFLAGIVVFGPSVSFIAAVQVVATAKASVAATIGAMAMIIVLTVSFAWIPLVAYLIAPDRTVRVLRSFDEWLRRHGRKIMVAAIGLIGVLLVIQGITGLA